jgi:hypothetical protein
MADAPDRGAEEKISHSGRDDRARKAKTMKTQEHSQEWL